MRDITQALKEHKEAVLSYGYKEEQILGIFLYGSQNYGVALEDSDVDTKCIIVPTVREATFNKIKTKTLILDNDEHCEIMDIAHLIYNLKKQNINFIEILFTDYCWVNPTYELLWRFFFTKERKRELITHYDSNKCLRSICGQAIHTLKQDPKDGKKIAEGIRLKYFLTHYLNGDNYLTCIKPDSNTSNLIKEYKKRSGVEEISEVVSESLIYWFNEISKLKVTSVKEKENDEEELNPEEINDNMERGACVLIEKRTSLSRIKEGYYL